MYYYRHTHTTLKILLLLIIEQMKVCTSLGDFGSFDSSEI